MTAITSHSIIAELDEPALTLKPSQAAITFDETWSPYVQATLVCPITDTALLEALDPRTERRITITVRQEFGRLDRLRDISRRYLGSALSAISATFAGGTIADISRSLFWHWTTPGAGYEAPGFRYMNLTLRSREIDHAAGTVTLTAASNEALLTDNAHLATNPHFVTATTVYEAVLYVLSRVDSSAGIISSGPTDTPFDSAKNPWKPGMSAWEWIAPIVQAAGLRLWCGQAGTWYLSDHQIEPPGPGIALTSSGPERSITQGVDRISRDAEFYTAVIVTYEWTDGAGVSQVAYDLARLPESITGTNQRVYNITYQKPYTGPGAAKRILTILLGRGRVIGVTAVSDYDAEPGRAATIALPSTPLQAGTVSAVVWRFPDDQMDVRLRGAIDAGDIETEYTPIPEED